jgi:hypothetical protein
MAFYIRPMLKPANRYILIEPLPDEKRGSLFIPLANAIPYKRGIVKAVAANVTQCKEGEEVVYMKRIVAEIQFGDGTAEFINEESLLYING